MLLAAAVVAGAVALRKSHTASSEARAALAGQLGAEAEVEPRIDRAMLLAREALRIERTNETKGTLLATLLRSPAALATYTLPIDSRPQNIAVEPHGHHPLQPHRAAGRLPGGPAGLFTRADRLHRRGPGAAAAAGPGGPHPAARAGAGIPAR